MFKPLKSLVVIKIQMILYKCRDAINRVSTNAVTCFFTITKSFWQAIRQLSGDDAYERYLIHYAQHHQTDGNEPLSKKEFFKRWQDEKWRGVKRCC